MASVLTTGVILPPDWLIMKKVAIPAEIAIVATFMKWDPDGRSHIDKITSWPLFREIRWFSFCPTDMLHNVPGLWK